MKLRIVTVGEPKLDYAKLGWQEYSHRLQHYHSLRTMHIPDKWAYDTKHLLEATKGSYRVALALGARQYTSHELAAFLGQKATEAREVSFIIGGPEGLPTEFVDSADLQLSLSELTFPHDLAMVVLCEALYRASTINSGQPYHK